ncbi:MAG: hypothetical protein IPO81_00280 [Kouleothrix sp.]|nr:hypothetical protein [Kouleothrix sp.]
MSAARDPAEDRLRDAAHDAFMAFWREADTPAVERLWRAYCAAQARYDDYLLEKHIQ